ncbi:unnamed protein product [Schistosoma rodhaini]|uniref:Uncharacterized protein n=1 Tax=Schistosoma rodhaini TaxID=6188 RepID=A0AA85FKF2_9TREM|nr:unnamed protein product [Schistosoma rodhaini]
MNKNPDNTSNQMEANLHLLESQHPELNEIAKSLAQIALHMKSPVIENATNNNETQSSLTTNDTLYRNFMHLQLQDPKIQNLLLEKQKQSQIQNSTSNNTIKNLMETILLNSQSMHKSPSQVDETFSGTTTFRSGSSDRQTIGYTGRSVSVNEGKPLSGSQSPCGSNISLPKYSDSSLPISRQTQSITGISQNNQEIIQLLQSIIQNDNSQNANLHNLNLLTQLLQLPIKPNGSNNVWSSIIQQLTKQLHQSYQQQQQHNNNNNENTPSITSNNNFISENTIPEIKTESIWTDDTNTQQNTKLPSNSTSYIQSTNRPTNTPIVKIQDNIMTGNIENVNQNSKMEVGKLNSYEMEPTHETVKTNHHIWSHPDSYNNPNQVVNTNLGYSRQVTNVSRLLNQERPWMRSHHRDRFVVRITSVTHRCSCRSSTPNRNRTTDSKSNQCQGKECKRSEPRIYVTFQTQLPSLSSPDNARKHGRHSHHIPLTGLRLGFSCPLTSQGPPMSDFETPKVAERFDSWEKAGNRPGFRVQILTALQHTVRQMLELIRTKGFGAVKLDTDYVFFPPAADLQPIYARRRPLSSSSDGSLPRVMGLERIRHEIENEPKNHSFNTKLSESLNYTEKPEQSVWSEMMSESEDNNTDNVFNTNSLSIPRNRPRTWYQSPGQNSLSTSPSIILTKNNSDYRINEITDMLENDDYHSIDKHINIDSDNNNNNNDKNIYYPMSSSTIVIPSNQSIQNTCWCTSNPTQYSLYHKSGHNSFLSTSQIAINPNVQMNYSPYPMVDERCWHNKSINTPNKLLRSLGAPYSTPVSPTRFIMGESTNQNQSNDFEANNLQPSASTEMVGKLERPKNPSPEYLQSTANSEQKRDYLSKILQEISNCLHTNPQYPIVIMPTPQILNFSEHQQATDNKNSKKAPLVFQIPHSNSVFIGLPATSGVNPRVMTASPTNAVIVLPSLTTDQQLTQQSTSQQQQQNCQHSPNTYTQPTILTGPKQGYLLIITPDNKYEYVPQP